MKRTSILFVLAFVATLFSFHSNAQVNIGAGTQTGLSLPIEPFFGYTYSQSIYLSSEVNATGTITGLTFYGESGISALTNSSTWVVYVGHTSKTSFANGDDWETGLTQVYSGTVSVVANNVTITFSTPFVYNGTDNLIVAVDENGSSYDNSSDEFLCTSTSTDRALTYRDDITNPDPAGTLPTASFVRQAIPNIQLIGITQTCPLPSALTATNITSSSADFGWTENGTATTWNVEHGTAGFTPTGTPTISGTTSNPVTIGSLMDDTSYDVYVQADCGPDSSAWVGPFTFTTLQSCPDPSALTATNITSSSADFGWTENGSATTWNVEYGTAGFTPTGTPTISGTTSNPVTIGSLMDNTTYDVYVQADCGADSSSWIGPVTFTTECVALVAPWLEPFSTNTLPSCWSQSGDNNWEYGSSATTPTGFADYGAAGLADHSTGGGGTFIGMDGSDNGNGEVSVLLTPIVDVSGLTNGQLSYYVFSNNTNDAAQNKLIVEVFDGAAWVQVDSIQQNLGANWVEYSTPLSSLTITGNVRARFTITGDNSAGGSTYYNDILIDDVAFNEIPTCPIPTALTSNNITATTADFGWTENGPATTWNVEYGVAGFTPTGTPTISGTTSNPVTLTSLTSNTTYEVYLQSDCGPDSSAWVGPYTFTTLQSCPDPSALTATNITSSSADFGWTENGSATTWNVEYGTAGFTPTGTPTISGTTSNPVTIGSLMDNTTYDVYVQADCGADSSNWVGPFSFATPCAAITPAYLTDFSTFMPTCWDEATNGTLATGPTGLGTGSWGQSGSLARINLFSTGKSDWLVSPAFDLSAGGWQLAIDANAHNFSNTSAFSGMGSDDSVQVAISTDGGLTWAEIYSFNPTNQPVLANATYTVDLSAYTGTSNMFGIRATEGTTNDPEDYYFNVSSFEIRVPPTCIDPSAINVSNIQPTTADISWTAGSAVQQGWEVSVVDAGMPAMGGTAAAASPYNATGLTANTTYDVYIREICSPGDTTGWVGPVSFTTLCATYIPDYLQDFATYVPECWEEAQGLLTPSSVLTPGSSSWTSDGFANAGTTGSARINIWTTNQDEWLISPSIDLTGGPFQLEYDIALTTFSGTAATTMDADDSLAIVISTDNGATWSNANILQTYTAGSEPSNTGDHTYIDLSAYTGVVKFGLYAASTLNLTVDNNVFIDNFEVTALCLPEYSTDVQTACESLTWIDGNTYTSNNNTAMHTLTNAAGCDSIVTLDLTILTPTFGTDVISACDSYTWIDGVTYTASNNTATDTLVNAAGCDSIVTLDLTILTTTGTDVISACESYTWIDGVTYTASNNTATDTLVNAAGCDSIVTLDLTITTPTFGTDVISACESYTWIDGVTYTASNNTATDTLVNAAGCDSIVTLDLTITTPTFGTDVISACDSYTWIDGVTYTASNNTATDTLVNAAGCDSIVTLDLTITTPNTGVTVSGATLTADITIGAGITLSWLDCDDSFAVIPGENGQSFSPATNGNYALRVVENTCVDTSACYLIDNVGLDATDFETVSIVPNPTSNNVYITFEDAQAELTIMDINGKLIDQLTINSGDSVDMTLFESGVYLFRVTSDSIQTVQRVVKQ